MCPIPVSQLDTADSWRQQNRCASQSAMLCTSFTGRQQQPVHVCKPSASAKQGGREPALLASGV